MQTGLDKVAHIAERSAGRLDKAFGILKAGLGGIAAGFSLGAFVQSIDRAIEKLDDLDERAQNLAVSAVDLSSLDITAQFSGVQSIDKALDHFNKTLAQSKSGSAQATAVLQALGVETKKLAAGTLDTTTAFRQAADGVKSYADGFEKSNLVQEAFGAKQAKLIAFLNQGGEALTKYAGASQEAIDAGVKFQANIDKLQARFDRLSLTIGGLVAGGLNRLFDDQKVNSDAQQVQRLTTQLERLKKNLADINNSRGGPGSELAAAVTQDIADLEARLGAFRKRAEDEAKRVEDAFNGGTKPNAPTVNPAAISFLKALEKQVELQEKGEFAAKRLEAQELKVAAAAEPRIRALELIKQRQDAINASVEANAAAEQRLADLSGRRLDLGEQVKDLQFQATLIGKSREEVERLTAAREFDRQAANATRGKEGPQVQALIDLYESFRGAIEGATKAKIEAQSAQDFKLLDFKFDEQIKDLNFATSLIGKTRDEIELLSAARDVDRDKARETFSLQGDALERTSALYDSFRLRVIAATEAQADVRRQLEPLIQTADSIGDAFGGFADTALNDFRDIGKAAEELGRDIQRGIIKALVSDPLSKAISDSIKKAMRDAGSEGNFDFIGWLRGLFNGSAGTTSGGGASSPQGGFASGGVLKPGNWGVAGENGPELIYGGRSGMTIYPNGMQAKGGGLPPIIVHVDSRTDRAEVDRSAHIGVRTALHQAREQRLRNAE